MVELTWLIPALPLAGFLLLVAFGRRLGEPLAGWLATLMVGGSFLDGESQNRRPDPKRSFRTGFDLSRTITLSL